MSSKLEVQKLSFCQEQQNNESTHRKFMSKKEVPKQALKQKHFREHYLTENHTGIEDWVKKELY